MIKDTSATDIVVESSRGQGAKQKVMIAAVLAALIIATTMGIMNWSSVEQSVSGARLRFSTVERGDFVRDIAVQGRIVAASSPTLYSPTQGIIHLMVRAGDRVNANQVLATIDSPTLNNLHLQEKSLLSRLQNEVERQNISNRKLQLKSQQEIDLADVRLDAAKREMRRSDASIGSNAISQIDYEKSEDDLNTAKLEFEHAKQDAVLEKESLEFELRTKGLDLERQELIVADIERQIEDLNIKAPVSGIVGDLLVQERENVAANVVLLTVVDLGAFEVEILVPESYSDDIGIDMQAELSLGGKTLPAVVTAVSPEVVNNQVKGRLRFVEGGVKELKQNQRLSARIILESKQNVLKVRRGPFLESGAGQIAYLVKDSVATKTSINTGSTSISEIEITGGLVEGDEIVISSHDLFKKANTILIN